MTDGPGTPGYDVLAEAREWLAEHNLPEDFADSLSDLLCDAVAHGRWEVKEEQRVIARRARALEAQTHARRRAEEAEALGLPSVAAAWRKQEREVQRGE